MSRPDVRRGHVGDVSAVLDLRWEVFDFVRTSPREEWDSTFGESLRDALVCDAGCLFVADHPDGGGIVAAAAGLLFQGLPRPGSKGLFVKVSSVATAAPFRRMGLARECMYQLVGWSTAKGCDRLILNSSPEGRLLYEGMGFLDNEAAMELRFPRRMVPTDVA